MNASVAVSSAMRRVGLLTLAAVLAASAAGLGAAAHAQPRFRHLTVDDGLSQNQVTALLQDTRGFLWVGTGDGLNRFDGYDFAIYQFDPTDQASLSDNRVGALLQARDGTLWVGTADGLNRYDPAADAFERFRHDPGNDATLADLRVAALYEDARGRLWIGHADPLDRTVGGLSRLDPETGRIERIMSMQGGALALPTPVHAFAEGADGTLWMATGRGLLRYDLAADTYTVIGHDPEDAKSLASNDVRALLVDSEGNVWAGTWGGGLDCYAPGTGEVIHHRAGPGGTDLASGFVSALGRTEEGVMWVGTSGTAPTDEALHRYDFKTFTRFTHAPGQPGSLGAGGVRALLEDHARVLWVGTAGGGLSRYDQASRPIPHYTPDPADDGSLSAPSVTAFLEEDKLMMWVGTAQGLDRFDRFNERFTHFRHDPADASTLSDDHVTALVRGPEGAVWVGTRGGLNRLSPQTGRARRYRADRADPGSLSSDLVHTLLVTADGTLWVGTAGGLDRFDPATGRFVHTRHNPADNASLSDNDVVALYEAPEAPGTLWIGTARGGLNRLDVATGRVTRYPAAPEDPAALSHRFVSTLATRPGVPGALWVGTLAGGLNRLDIASGRFTRFTQRTGEVPGNTIYALLPGDEGALWLATNQGLARFDPDSNRTRVYDVDRGVQSRQFNVGAAHRTPRGELAFGGINGFNLFAPGELEDSPYPPRVALTGLRIDGVPVQPGAGSPLAQPLALTDELTLGHTRNDLTFEFVGLHFGRPEANRYAVRLDGADDAGVWRDLGTQRSVSYANLTPGRYVFRAKAANSDGVWSPDDALALAVFIAPPWWQTWWFRFLALGLGIGAAVSAYRWRVRSIAERNRELEHLVAERTEALREQKVALEAKNDELEATLGQLRTAQTQLVHAEKLASLGRVTAGVAHEIKNPLNFVNNFAQLSEELTGELREGLRAAPERPVAEVYADLEPLLEDLALNVAKIHQHGRRADGIVRAMLLHARGTEGDREPTDLHVLLDETIGLAVHGAKGEVPVHVERGYDPAVEEIVIIRQAVGRAVLNLIENAFYAVRERAATEGEGYRPTVHVRTHATGPAVVIEVEDNGPGIAEDKRARLFEPFFTTKPTGKGTGLGLSLAHDIAQSHGGALAVRSTEGEGSVFSLTLPK